MGTLAGWAYRKPIVINATADGTMTNYQMKVALIKAATGVYGNTGGIITTDGANTVHTFIADGTFIPCKTGIVKVECWGAGGGGGYRLNDGGGGGGGGAYAATPNVAVTAGVSYAIVRGTGGARDTAGVAASSTFAGATVVALGGTGVSSNIGGAGGVGASGTGTTKNSGGAGKGANTTADSGGGGGGAGGPDGNGVDGTVAGNNVGGAGGAGDNGSGGAGGVAGDPGGDGGGSALGGGGGAGNSSNDQAGGNGGLPGGGGAGTDNAGVGAVGGNGQVVVTCVTADFLTADTPGTIYLNNHCLNWPTDILFTLSDGTTTAGADFCREESDATDGTWWLEANSIPAGSTFNGYIYYGKIDAADASNGANTFLFFDDFPGVAIDTDKWDVTGAGGVVASSVLTITTSVANSLTTLLSKTNWMVNATTSYRARIKTQYFNSNSYGEQHAGFGAGYNYVAEYVHRTGGAQGKYTGTTKYAITGWDAGNWHIQQCDRTNNTGTWTVDNANSVVEAGYTITPCPICLNGTYNTAPGWIAFDWVLVKNFTANEPTWGTTGAEENLLGGGSSIRNKVLSYRREHIKRMEFHKRLLLK